MCVPHQQGGERDTSAGRCMPMHSRCPQNVWARRPENMTPDRKIPGNKSVAQRKC